MEVAGIDGLPFCERTGEADAAARKADAVIDGTPVALRPKREIHLPRRPDVHLSESEKVVVVDLALQRHEALERVPDFEGGIPRQHDLFLIVIPSLQHMAEGNPIRGGNDLPAARIHDFIEPETVIGSIVGAPQQAHTDLEESLPRSGFIEADGGELLRRSLDGVMHGRGISGKPRPGHLHAPKQQRGEDAAAVKASTLIKAVSRPMQRQLQGFRNQLIHNLHKITQNFLRNTNYILILYHSRPQLRHYR